MMERSVYAKLRANVKLKNWGKLKGRSGQGSCDMGDEEMAVVMMRALLVSQTGVIFW